MFLLVPEPLQHGLRGEFVAGLRVPEDHQIVDVEDQRSGALRGAGDAILRIFEAQELLRVTKANFQRPAQRKRGEDLGGSQVDVGREEAIVAATMRGSCTTTMRSNLWPALEYQRASTVLYQTRTRLP